MAALTGGGARHAVRPGRPGRAGTRSRWYLAAGDGADAVPLPDDWEAGEPDEADRPWEIVEPVSAGGYGGADRTDGSGRYDLDRLGHGDPAPRPSWLARLLGAGPADDEWAYRGRRRNRRPGSALAAVLGTVVTVLAMVLFLAFFPVSRHPAAAPAAGAGRAAGPVAFPPLTIEAESAGNTLTGTAVAVDYPGASGGRVVRGLGRWGTGPGDGALRFNDVVVPATTEYVLTFYFVDPNNEPTRSAVITAAGSSLTVVVAGSNLCCAAQALRVVLVKGRNTITFANPQGHAPAIDRITVALP